MSKKKKVVKQKQKQKQKQSQYVKININNPVKKVYKKATRQTERMPYVFQGSAPPIINVSIPSQERTFEKYFEQLKESLAQKIGEPIGDKFNLNNSIFENLEESQPTLEESKNISINKKPKRRKPKLIIEEDTETQTNISVPNVPPLLPPSKIPRLNKEPTIQELKKKYIDLTGDKESAKNINKGNKQNFIDLINRMEK